MPIAAAMPSALEEVEDEVHGAVRRAIRCAGSHDCRQDAKGRGLRRRTPSHGPAAIQRTRPRALRGPVRPRTQGMKSSAMRDLMAVTAQPDIISLAGGLPDTSTFPAEDLAALMARMAAESSAAALQYGPTEGLEEVKHAIVEVMAAEGMTRRARRPARHDRRPAGDRPRLPDADRSGRRRPRRGADLPGRRARLRLLPGRRRADRDGRRRHAHRRCSRRSSTGSTHEGRTPKFIYTIPSFQNPAGVTMSLERRRTLVRIAQRARAARARGQPVRAAALRGRRRCRRCYALDGGEYVIYLGTFSKILSPGLRAGLDRGPASRAGQAQPRQGGRRPLLPGASRSTSSPPTSPRATGARTCARSSTSTAAAAT